MTAAAPRERDHARKHCNKRRAVAMSNVKKAAYYSAETGVWPLDEPGIDEALQAWPASCRAAFDAARADDFIALCVRCRKFARPSVAAGCRQRHLRSAALEPRSTPTLAGASLAGSGARLCVSPIDTASPPCVQPPSRMHGQPIA